MGISTRNRGFEKTEDCIAPADRANARANRSIPPVDRSIPPVDRSIPQAYRSNYSAVPVNRPAGTPACTPKFAIRERRRGPTPHSPFPYPNPFVFFVCFVCFVDSFVTFHRKEALLH